MGVKLPGLLSSARILFSLVPGFGFLLAVHMAILQHRPDVVDSHNRVRDTPVEHLLERYDFIIIGAGSAGAVVANRLSENYAWNVLLLEAGADEHILGDLPLMMPALQLTEADWKFTTLPNGHYCQAMKDGVCNWPRGKVLGGSSALNAMLYARGNKKDFDHWQELGNDGWSYDQVLPYFKKSEDMRIEKYRNDPHHGTGGYLTIEHYRYHQPLAKRFKDAAIDLGYRMVDINGETQTGFTYPHGTLRDGLRCSTNKAFLRPASKRKNLHVSMNSHVEKILIDEKTKTAHGVRFKKGDERYDVFATKEIILSAGAVQSPQILMLSGVGDADHLIYHKIKPIVNLPGVGKNLQDHVAMGGMPYLYESKYDLGLNSDEIFTDETIEEFVKNHDGLLYNLPECEMMGFVSTKYANHSEDFPDIQLFLGAFAENSDGGLFGKRDMRLDDDMYATVYEDILYKPTYSAVPLLLRPKSRGYIHLKDKDPHSKPLINPNYFADPYDIKVLAEGARIAYKISQTPTMKKLKVRLHHRKIPGCEKFDFFSDEHLECQARHHTLTIYHPVGTCKMAPHGDPTGVVDPTLKVYGVKNLRVVDASIMPHITSANTNAAAIMIGEKASDMIKDVWLTTGSDKNGHPASPPYEPSNELSNNKENTKIINFIEPVAEDTKFFGLNVQNLPLTVTDLTDEPFTDSDKYVTQNVPMFEEDSYEGSNGDEYSNTYEEIFNRPEMYNENFKQRPYLEEEYNHKNNYKDDYSNVEHFYKETIVPVQEKYPLHDDNEKYLKRLLDDPFLDTVKQQRPYNQEMSEWNKTPMRLKDTFRPNEENHFKSKYENSQITTIGNRPPTKVDEFDEVTNLPHENIFLNDNNLHFNSKPSRITYDNAIYENTVSEIDNLFEQEDAHPVPLEKGIQGSQKQKPDNSVATVYIIPPNEKKYSYKEYLVPPGYEADKTLPVIRFNLINKKILYSGNVDGQSFENFPWSNVQWTKMY